MKYALKTGQKTVATAGTQLALVSSSTWARTLRLTAPASNAGLVYIGDSNVDSSTGIAIAAGDTLSFSDLLSAQNGDIPLINLASVYVDAANNGDKITFAYLDVVQ